MAALSRRLLLLCVALLPCGAAFAATPPAAPSELRIVQTPADHYGHRLLWKSNSNGDETGFEISNGNTIRRVGKGTTYYRWGTTMPGGYMCFRIRAYKEDLLGPTVNSAWEPNVEPWYRCGTETAGTNPQSKQMQSTTGYYGYGQTCAEFGMVGGTWWVPRVECKASGIHGVAPNRAAVWVGLAGQEPNPWLVQVGTYSQCDSPAPDLEDQANNLLGKPTYKAFLQLYRNQDGKRVEKLFSVQDGDLISAIVSYNPQKDNFEITINDVSQNIVRSESRKPSGATAYNSRTRSLCIVEEDTDGLARFNTPIEWWGCVSTLAPNQGSPTLLRFDRDRQATVSPVGESGGFTVWWQQQLRQPFNPPPPLPICPG